MRSVLPDGTLLQSVRPTLSSKLAETINYR